MRQENKLDSAIDAFRYRTHKLIATSKYLRPIAILLAFVSYALALTYFIAFNIEYTKHYYNGWTKLEGKPEFIIFLSILPIILTVTIHRYVKNTYVRLSGFVIVISIMTYLSIFIDKSGWFDPYVSFVYVWGIAFHILFGFGMQQLSKKKEDW